MSSAQNDRVAGQEFLSLFSKLDNSDQNTIIHYMQFMLTWDKYKASQRVIKGSGDKIVFVDFRK